MLDSKKLIIAFLIGFFLSFVFGLIGHVHIGVLFLRAFMFGALFAGLAFGAIFVFNNFLQVGEATETTTVIEDSVEKESHAVDILIDDELPDTQTSPTFEIIDDGQVNDVGKSIPSSNQETFVLKPIVSNEDNNAQNFEQQSIETVPEKEAVKMQSSSSELAELDELEQLLPSEDSFVEGDNDDEFSDEELFESDNEALGVTMSVGSDTSSTPDMNSNAEDMAAAVRTMLVNEP